MKPTVKLFLPITLGFLLVLGMGLSLHAQVVLAQSTPDNTPVIDAGLAYIESQQAPSGGVIGFSGNADPDTTARSVMAFVVAGEPVTKMVTVDGNSMLDYLATQGFTFTHDITGTLFPGRAGELLAAVSLAGEDPHTFAGFDLINDLNASLQTDTGAYNTNARQDYTSGEASDLSQAWAILGLSLAGQSIPQAATQYLVQAQAVDGSWGAGDPDTTALAVTALLASRNVDVQNEAIQLALDYFHNTQAPSGGWKPSWDTDPLNADSTGWILQALVSAGEDQQSQSWTKQNTNPVQALLGLLKPDGSIGGTYANTYSTAEAIIGLAGVPLSSLGKTPAVNRVGLAIFSGNDSLFTDCISFTGSSISGLELLQQSGLEIETATNPTQGTAVCKIGNVGDASNNCFGSMPDYWAYWELGKDSWDYSPIGADQSKVVDRGVYAWSWGTGTPPPVITFLNICEGVPFVLPTSTATSVPATATDQPATLTATDPAQITPQPTAPSTEVSNNTDNYITYGAILVVVILMIVFLARARRR